MKPSLSVEIGEEIRCDIISESVEKVYPNLPKIKHDWTKHKEYVKLRYEYLKRKDESAYKEIKSLFPGFKPPHLKTP